LRLRERWPYILEDEAQDSSRLCRSASCARWPGRPATGCGWATPTRPSSRPSPPPARSICAASWSRRAWLAQDLPNSGRSTLSIIGLANHLIDWTNHNHPEPAVRNALAPPHIEPTPPGDPQPNPPDDPDGIFLMPTKFSPEGEVRAVVESLARWLPNNPSHCGRAGPAQPARLRGGRCAARTRNHGGGQPVAQQPDHPPGCRRIGQPVALPGRPDGCGQVGAGLRGMAARSARGQRSLGGRPGDQQATASYRASRGFRLAEGRPRLAGRSRDRRGPTHPPGGLPRPGAALAGRGLAANRPNGADPGAGLVRASRATWRWPTSWPSACSKPSNRIRTGGCQSWPTS
jgi:hypothetical protein